MKAKVTRAHTATYQDPIQGRAGDPVTIGKPDPDNPDWVWCKAGDGREGWVQVTFLGDGELSRDYDATELTVGFGDELRLIEERSGWWWCETAGGLLGWVPSANVAAGPVQAWP